MTDNELKITRKKIGLTQKEAAALMRVSERTWQRYETMNDKDIDCKILPLWRIKLHDYLKDKNRQSLEQIKILEEDILLLDKEKN